MTASKPMYAKNTMAAPALIPAQPLGANGVQLAGLHPVEPDDDEERQGRGS